MIKNLIFDLDDTIIKYEDEDALHYKEALRNLGYDDSNYAKIFEAIDDYEASLTENNYYYQKQAMIEYVNHKLHTNYAVELIDELNRMIETYWVKRVILPEKTIQYLSKKYNCFVFSNWFEKTQAERLRKIGYQKYFKKVLGADVYGGKPFSSAYQNVLQELHAKPEECIMIGDNKWHDIWGANRVGMKGILIDYNGKRDKKEIQANDYITIHHLKELETVV